jgi:hypothetical protein
MTTPTNIVAVLVLVANIGCTKVDSEGNPVPSPSTQAPKDATVDYLAVGVPSPDKAWGLDDYSKAATALGKLKPGQLPRHDSEGIGGEIYARMVSEENLKLLTDDTAKLEDRLKFAAKIVRVIVEVESVYVRAIEGNKEPLGREFIDFHVLALISSNRSLATVQSLIAAIPENERKMGEVMQLYLDIEKEAQSIFRDVLRFLGRTEMFTHEELMYLAGRMKTLGPELLLMSNPSEEELLDRINRLTELLDSTEYFVRRQSLKKEIRAVGSALRSAAKKQLPEEVH